MRPVFLTLLVGLPLAAQESRQATGVRVGEVTTDSAVVWMRVTAQAARNKDGIVRRGKASAEPFTRKIEELEGA